MKKFKRFCAKHKQLILYMLFGILTTIVSLGAWVITLKVGVKFIHDDQGQPTELLDIIGSTTQWVSGVLVAFVTNKRWVFSSAQKGRGATLRQLALFSGSRVGTYVLEVVINLAVIALFDLLSYKAFLLPLGFFTLNVTSRIWAKLISSVFIIITNYFISKLLVFKAKK